MDVLRPQADVSHHRYAGRDQGTNRLGLIDTSFQLHGLAASFLENAARAFHRLVHAQVIGRKRHVDHNQRPLDRSADDLGVIDHFVQRHRQRRLVPLHDHRNRIADQHGFDSSGVDQPGRGIVVGRQHGDLLARRLE